MKFSTKVFLGLLIAIAIKQANAAQLYVTTEVLRTITTGDDKYGGCMFEPSISLISEGLDCQPGGWISLDCAGIFGTQNAGQRRWDAVVLAEMLNKKVEVRVDDSKKIDRYCVAERVKTVSSE